MAEFLEAWMVRWLVGWIAHLVDRMVGCFKFGGLDGLIVKWMDGCKVERLDGWMNGGGVRAMWQAAWLAG